MNVLANYPPTDELQAIDSAHHMHPFSHGNELATRGPRVITSAKGVWLKDSDGEEIIDGMVFELYFDEEFQQKGITFFPFVEQDFQQIDELKNEVSKIEAIQSTYQKLQEKDNKIRNNLKLMKIELRDLLMPIISA